MSAELNPSCGELFPVITCSPGMITGVHNPGLAKNPELLNRIVDAMFSKMAAKDYKNMALEKMRFNGEKAAQELGQDLVERVKKSIDSTTYRDYQKDSADRANAEE